ncbi:MAG TPA: hypothetical protein VNL14_08135 [Candidatus Acidoferrales bacterium]|nr:hypothetical protein [Candidatus Acidoferrales bacterium]
MRPGNSHDQTLRAIGQALEAARVVAFSLKRDGSRFVVQGESEKISGLRALFRRQRPFGQKNFTAEEIAELEHRGRAQRKQPDRLPDFRRLSSLLRAAGAYIDMNGGQLLELCKRDQNVIILFQNKLGHPQLEERTTRFLSDLAVRLYKKRQKKPA